MTLEVGLRLLMIRDVIIHGIQTRSDRITGSCIPVSSRCPAPQPVFQSWILLRDPLGEHRGGGWGAQHPNQSPVTVEEMNMELKRERKSNVRHQNEHRRRRHRYLQNHPRPRPRHHQKSRSRGLYR
jgi:hypothetical protein